MGLKGRKCESPGAICTRGRITQGSADRRGQLRTVFGINSSAKNAVCEGIKATVRVPADHVDTARPSPRERRCRTLHRYSASPTRRLNADNRSAPSRVHRPRSAQCRERHNSVGKGLEARTIVPFPNDDIDGLGMFGEDARQTPGSPGRAPCSAPLQPIGRWSLKRFFHSAAWRSSR